MYQKELNDLLKYNDERYKEFTTRPFFKMVASDDLQNDEEKRHHFFDYMQIFADHFQKMIYARQGTCLDNRFYATFLEHLKEEIGHDDLLRCREQVEARRDPILSAIGGWFTYQMIALDNVEKAALVHLVLETAGEFYHSFSDKMLGNHVQSDYYEIHSENDEQHAEMAIALLKGYPDFVYQRLHRLLNEGWDMINTMVDRVYTLVSGTKSTIQSEEVLFEEEPVLTGV